MTKANELLVKLQGFDPSDLPEVDYEKQSKYIANYLTQLSPEKLVAGTSDGDDFLDLLDPSIQTIPYLVILIAHVQNSTKKAKSTSHSAITLDPSGPLWTLVLKFLQRFDPCQVKYVSSEFRELLEVVTRTANTRNAPSLAIIPLRDAILRLDPTSSILTSTHLIFVRQCLAARAYAMALPVIDHAIYHIPSPPERGTAQRSHQMQLIEEGVRSPHLRTNSELAGKLSSREYMEYFLYCGQIYIGLQQWRRALFCLEVVLTIPTANSASMVMVHAYKKWILVGILLKGKPPELPKTINQPAAKAIRAIAKPYDVVADAFKDPEAARLEAEIHYGRGIWDGDCNTGLMQHVYWAHRKFAVLNLEKTFTALSIAQIASRTSPDPTDLEETQSYVSSLISSGDLAATLSPSSNPAQGAIVRFLPSPTETKSEADLNEDLARQRAELATLLQHVQSEEYRLEISKEYIDQLRKMKKALDAMNEKGGTSKNADALEIDEDVMGEM